MTLEEFKKDYKITSIVLASAYNANVVRFEIRRNNERQIDFGIIDRASGNCQTLLINNYKTISGYISNIGAQGKERDKILAHIIMTMLTSRNRFIAIFDVNLGFKQELLRMFDDKCIMQHDYKSTNGSSMYLFMGQLKDLIR